MKKGRTPYTKADFKWVKWTPADIRRVGKEILARKKERYASIKRIAARDRTFANTIAALEASDNDLGDLMAQIGILKDASPLKSIREVAGDVSQALSKAFVEIEFDPRIYQAIKEYAAKKERLKGEGKLLFDDMRKVYARMGFDLPKKKLARLKSNLKRLGKLGLAYDRNLNEYKDHIVVTRTQLDGLPETYISGLKRDTKGNYLVTLDYPDYIPFMAGAHDAGKRKELMEKKSRKGGEKNVAIIKEMIRLRTENAKLLGYKNHVDYKLELRMAKSAKKVRAFLEDLKRKTKAAAAHDAKVLKAFKAELTGNPNATLTSHDLSYLFKRLRKEKYDIDGDFVKEHFPFEHVKQATLGAYQKLLGVRFVRREGLPLWHPDVQFYDIHDPKEGYLASFALDLFPRDGKYGHAAVFDIVYGREEHGTYVPPLAAMITNFPKPTKTNPSLMSHGEVETFFHEFGHVVHFTLTKAKYRSQAGTNTAWDFVEAPSQMLENWVWDEDMLKRLSKHYKTGKPLPSALIRRMIAAKLLGEAWGVRGQVALAMFDHLLHTGEAKNPVSLYAKLERELLGVPAPKGQIFVAGFGHLAHGYDAGYYGYLWSRVYAEDMFTRFKKTGLLDPKVGREYRQWILEKGSSMEEMDLIKGFLRRKPNSKAFLKSIGVA
jgi:thimet oligopeptidase